MCISGYFFHIEPDFFSIKIEVVEFVEYNDFDAELTFIIFGKKFNFFFIFRRCFIKMIFETTAKSI